MIDHKYWNVKSSILIVHDGNETSGNVEDFAHILCSKNILNVAFFNLRIPSKLTAFNKFNQAKYDYWNASLDDWNNIMHFKAKDLFGYKIKISQYGVYPRAVHINNKIMGSDHFLLNTMLEYLNGSYDFTSPNDSNSFLSTMTDVLEGRSEINFNLRLYFKKGSKRLNGTWSYPYETSRICVIVPHVPLNTFKVPIYTKENTLYLVSCFAIGFLWYFAAKSQYSAMVILFELIRVTSLSAIPFRLNAITEKILVMCSVWLAFFYVNLIQTSLIAFMIKPNFPSNMNTIQELNDSGLPIHVPNGYLQMMNQIDAQLYDTFFLSKFNESKWRAYSAVQDGLFPLPAFLVFEYNVKEYLKSIANYHEGIPYWHLVDECLYFSFSAYLFQKHSPYLEYFNEVMIRTREAGLDKIWKLKSTIELAPYSKIYQNVVKEYFGQPESELTLTFCDLLFIFYLYLIALAIAVLIFVCEIIQHKRTVMRGKRITDIETI